MDRNSKAILLTNLWLALACIVGITYLAATDEDNVVPSLECSVDDTLTFVAYDVTSWDMKDGTLVVRSVETTHEFTLSRDTLDGETCREVFP